MKTSRWLAASLMIGALVFGGCSNSDRVDTSNLELNFQVADSPLQQSALTAIAAIRSADHAAGLAELKKLVRNVKLTPEQRGSIRRAMAQLEKMVVKHPSIKVAPEAPLVAAGR